MLAAGYMGGKRVWVRIMKAIEELQRTEKGPEEWRISLRDGYPALSQP